MRLCGCADDTTSLFKPPNNLKTIKPQNHREISATKKSGRLCIYEENVLPLHHRTK